MRFPTMVRLVVGVMLFAVTALGMTWVLEGTSYTLGAVGMVVACVFTVGLALEPELRGAY